jgi:hypothetical protein
MDEFGLMREPEIFVRQSVFKDLSLHHLIRVLSISAIERLTLNVSCDLFIDLIGNCRDMASCHFRNWKVVGIFLSLIRCELGC